MIELLNKHVLEMTY